MEKQQTEKRAFLDVLINNAVEKAIVKKDLTSNSDVYQIIEEVAERLRYPVTGGRYGQPARPLNRTSQSPFTLSKGGF